MNDEIKRKVNSHIHVPPNFSAFDSVKHAVDLASEQAIGILGVSNYYDFSVYREFKEVAREKNIYPLFGLEIIVLIDELRRKGVKINDPGNPGKMYICGKGITQYSPMNAEAEGFMDIIRRNDKSRIAEMIKLMAEIFSRAGVETNLTEEKIISTVASRYGCSASAVYLQERHVAQAFQESFVEKVSPDERQNKLNQILGADLTVDIDDAVKVQGAVRSCLMKSGKPAFVEEKFIDFSQAYKMISELGGIPCYPTLADGVSPICGYEEPVSKLIDNLRGLKVHCAEFIPVRNKPAVLVHYVKSMRDAGMVVLGGTEHNTQDLIHLEPECLNGTPVPDEVKEIFFEGACVVAGHQFMRSRGECGYLDEHGELNPAYNSHQQRIEAFREIGAEAIEKYMENKS